MMYQYNDYELDAAVEYISKNNPYGFSKTQVRDSIIDSIERYYRDPNIAFTGTMGYKVHFINDFEDIVQCEIWVTPSFRYESKYITVDDGKIIDVEYIDV